jgi:hypothetical protein
MQSPAAVVSFNLDARVWRRQEGLHIIIKEFITLDGAVQAPARADEDTDEDFQHGGVLQGLPRP